MQMSRSSGGGGAVWGGALDLTWLRAVGGVQLTVSAASLLGYLAPHATQSLLFCRAAAEWTATHGLSHRNRVGL